MCHTVFRKLKRKKKNKTIDKTEFRLHKSKIKKFAASDHFLVKCVVSQNNNEFVSGHSQYLGAKYKNKIESSGRMEM